MFSSLPPGALLVLFAPLLVLLRGRALQVGLLALPIVSFAHMLLGFELGDAATVSVYGLELQTVRFDALSRVWGVVFHLAAISSAIFSLGVKDRIQHVMALAYAGAAIAAVFAGDLVSLFVWWELTAVTSVFLIWASRTEVAYRSGLRYLVFQVLSGVLLLSGVLFRHHAGIPLSFDDIGLTGTIDSTLLFIAFGIKAAFPLLHTWLKDAYPNATPTGTVWLSSFTTKLAIYALARGFAGTDLLIPIGVAMALFPLFYAVIENDLRKVLAYSLNNQLGFMVVGVGIGTEFAINGVAAHAFAHVLYKSLLFMGMGAVLMRTGTSKGTDLGGLYRSMPYTTAFTLVGAAAASAVPFTSGFISKSMILSAAGHEHLTLVYLALMFAGVGVFQHAGIKVPYMAFFGADSGRRVDEAPLHMLVAMGLVASGCVLIGVMPSLVYGLLPSPVTYEPYTADHVVSQMQLLLGAAVAVALLHRIGAYPAALRSELLDSDWVSRRVVPSVYARLSDVVDAARLQLVRSIERGRVATLSWAYRRTGPGSRWASTWSSSAAALSVALVLTLYAMLFFQLGDAQLSGVDAHDGSPAADHVPSH